MKKYIGIFAVIAVLGAVFIIQPTSSLVAKETKDKKVVSANTGEEIKIGVVDIPMILRKSLAAKDIRSQLEAKSKEYEKKIGSKEKELRSEEKKLLGKKDSMKEAEFKTKGKAFQKEIVDAQKTVMSYKKTLDVSVNNSMQELRNKIARVVAETAKKKGVNIVLSQDGVVLAEKSLDMTEEIISSLNKSVKKMPVKWQK